MLKSSFSLALAFLCFSGLQAQSKSQSLKQAETYYDKSEYYTAAQYYEQYLGVGKLRKERWYPYNEQGRTGKKIDSSDYYHAAYKLADCYRLLNDYETAGIWYGKVALQCGSTLPLSHLYYGVCLRTAHRLDSAATELEFFSSIYRISDPFLELAQRELQNLQFIRQQESAQAGFTVAPVATSLSANSAYAPAWLDESTLVFSSSAKDSGTAKNGGYINHLYRTNWTNPRTTNASEKLMTSGDSQAPEGSATFTDNGNTMYFTRLENAGNGKPIAAIYVSTRNNSRWSEAKKLSTAVNAEGYNAKQPSVSADGHYLFFASDRAGGKGGFDIWYIQLDNTQPTGEATNLSDINTTANDEAPFYHSPTNTLVFASNGRIGMGGYDLYSSKGDFKTWSEPANLGAPVNSVKDDIYFSTASRHDAFSTAVFSSDRASGCCLQLFVLQVIEKPKPVAAPAPEPVVVDTTPAPVAPIIVKEPSVYFAFNSAKLGAAAKSTLDSIAETLIDQPNVRYLVSGYTDTKGADNYNVTLSKARVNTCLNYLASKGVDTSKIESAALGECCPVESETLADGKDNAAGRSKNRRVEFRLVKP